MYIKTLPYANATLCQNFKAIGDELSEISGYVQTNLYIFIYIDLGCIGYPKSSSKALGYMPDDLGSIPGAGGVQIFHHFFVPE